MSTTSGTTDPTDGFNPWFLAHGIVFIIGFSILMPMATFLILYDKDRFYATHSIIGVVILMAVVAGEAFLGAGRSPRVAGEKFEPENRDVVGDSHFVTGVVAKYLTVGVCLFGILLRVWHMPKRIKLYVRILHGVVGALLTFYGVIVVWNGWVLIAVTFNSVLDTTPIIWSLVLVGFVAMYPYFAWKERRILFFIKSSSDDTTPVDIESPRSSMSKFKSLGSFVDVVRDKKFFVYNKTEIIIWDDEFEHPGGNVVIEPYFGKDITNIFSGQATFFDETSNMNRAWLHSNEALEKLRSMRVGLFGHSNSAANIGGDSVLVTSPSKRFSQNRASVDLDEVTILPSATNKAVGMIAAIEPANGKMVMKIELKILDAHLFSIISEGSKIKLSAYYESTAVERTYTTAGIDTSQKSITLFIKIYPNGAFTSLLEKKKVTDIVFISGVAPPLALPEHTERVVMLAGGTGLVPMLYYLASSADSDGLNNDYTITKKIVPCHLLWWVRDVHDLFLVSHLNKCVSQGGTKLTIFFTNPGDDFTLGDSADRILADLGFSNANGNLSIKTGRISKSVVLDAYEADQVTHSTVVMSGPPGFISTATESVKELPKDKTTVYCLD